MREVISVHVGQAGVQIGNACCKSLWRYAFTCSIDSTRSTGELYTAEHGLGVSSTFCADWHISDMLDVEPIV